MEPSFKQIAELFEVELPTDQPNIDSKPRKLKGDNARESGELGRQCLSEGDYQNAIKHFKTAIEQRGKSEVPDIVNLASAYEYADQAPQAFRQYEKALKIQQDTPEPFLGLSDLYKRYGRFKESIEQLRTAILLEPQNAFYHIKLAETFREMGERKRAIQAAQGAIAAEPTEPFYHYWLGDLFIELKRYDEALDSLRAAIELSPGDDYLYVRACVAFWMSEKQQEAVKAIRLASDLDPDKHVYHGLLQMLLLHLELRDEAALEEDRASKMDRYDIDLLRRLLAEMEIEVSELAE